MKDQRRQKHIENKRDYETEIRKAKLNSWKECCNAITTVNPWTVAYKLASGNINNIYTLTTLWESDDLMTRDVKEIINYIIDYFVPVDKKTNDNQYHKEVKIMVDQQLNTHNDRLFTREEVRACLDRIENNAPGEDGVTGEFLRQIIYLLPVFTTAIFNAYL